jgi:hypothetical protein
VQLVIHPGCDPSTTNSRSKSQACAAHGEVADEIPDQRKKLDDRREQCEDRRSELYRKSEVSTGRMERGTACTSRDDMQMQPLGMLKTLHACIVLEARDSVDVIKEA